jgi:hypothetical protein
MDLAYKMFEKMPKKITATCTSMITRFTQLGYSREAMDFVFGYG